MIQVSAETDRKYGHNNGTEDPRYNDSVCCQRFCCKIEFAVIKKLYKDPLNKG